MSEIHGFQVELERPFDLDLTVDSWVFSDIQPTPEKKRPGEFARCLPINNALIPVRVIQLRKGANPSLQLQWPAKFGSDYGSILTSIEWLLGWDIDTQPVLKEIMKDPVIAHLEEPLRGLRPFSQPTLFEAIVKAILQQQVSFRSANQVTRRLVLDYGPQCYIGDDKLFGFPSLETLLNLSEAELRACKLGYKAPYLIGLFKAISSGSLKLEALSMLDTNSILSQLDALRGIGRWTAELAVLTGLRRLEVFPADDLGIRQIISQLYLNGKPAKRDDVDDITDRWGDVGSFVLYFLMCAQVLGFV